MDAATPKTRRESSPTMIVRFLIAEHPAGAPDAPGSLAVRVAAAVLTIHLFKELRIVRACLIRGRG